jgi:hypothetical protein
MGERMVVQFARGARKRDDAPAFHERTAPRPRRTLFRMSITSLPVETSWQVSTPNNILELLLERIGQCFLCILLYYRPRACLYVRFNGSGLY